MRKLTMSYSPTRRKIVPLVLAVANKVIEELGFVKKINEVVQWDKSQ